MNMHQLPPALQQAIRNECKPYETVSWLAQPIPHAVRKANMTMMFFGIPFTAFAIFWTIMASAGEVEFNDAGENEALLKFIFPLFGVPFIAVGLYLLSTPFRLAKAALRTAYVITNQRAFSITAGKDISVSHYHPDQLRQRKKILRADGSGSLVFVETIIRMSGGKSRVDREGFEHITDIKKAEHAIDILLESQQANAQA